MPVTIVSTDAMPNADMPPGNAYADHELALEYKSSMTFKGGTPSNTGVFPDFAVDGIDGTDKYHVHAISAADIIWRISVTFLLKGDHIGNAFYWPIPTRSKTFNRYCTRLPKFSKPARDLADEVFESFFNACAKTTGKTANEALVAMINRRIKTQKETEEREAQEKLAAAKAAPVVSASAKDRSLLGQDLQKNVMTNEEAQAKIDAYVTKSKVTLGPGDNRAILVCLKEGRPKDQWTGFVKKYYDGIMT
jgi:hypothetical protein